MRENQATITAWVRETFGKVSSIARAKERTEEEFAEFRRAAYPADIAAEAADVVICLFAVCESIGHSLMEEVNRKMVINRSRKWESRGDGTGYHVK